MTLTTASPQTQHKSRLGIEVLPGCNVNHLTDIEIQELKNALWQHGVIVVRKQQITASELREFARRTFGEFTFKSQLKELDPEISPDLQSPHVAILGNPKGIGTEVVGKFAEIWHHDKDLLPSTQGLDMNALYVVMLYGVQIPPAGMDGNPHTTEFLDMQAAYENLDPEYQQQLEKLSFYHLPPFIPKNTKPEDIPRKLHPIVSTHKVTGTKGLYLGSDTAILEDMQEQPEQAKEFWQDLFQKVLDSTPIYSHIWQEGDIVLWDNSQVMHRGMPYDNQQYQRIALRLGIIDKSVN